MNNYFENGFKIKTILLYLVLQPLCGLGLTQDNSPFKMCP